MSIVNLHLKSYHYQPTPLIFSLVLESIGDSALQKRVSVVSRSHSVGSKIQVRLPNFTTVRVQGQLGT